MSRTRTKGWIFKIAPEPGGKAIRRLEEWRAHCTEYRRTGYSRGMKATGNPKANPLRPNC
jgi:hypothetical protein